MHVILRHWNGAINRKQHTRPDWFSYEKCYRSIKNEVSKVTVLLDGSQEGHHINFDKEDTVVEFKGGTDHSSLLFALNYIKSQNYKDDDVVYLVEDDYLHHPGWKDILLDAYENIDADYVTLYDHPDKYWLPMYSDLQSKLISTNKCHWRTAPSTCSTYSGKWKTFKKHWDKHHIKWCLPEYTHDGYDHTKFIKLWEDGSNLISPIPGYSTHCESQFLSPTIKWDKI